jgi:hypothetical protein
MLEKQTLLLKESQKEVLTLRQELGRLAEDKTKTLMKDHKA